jgi:diguanylate cyclase
MAEQTSPANSAEILRLALPLMSRHGVAVTPQNYAIWFDYVVGSNQELVQEIDRRIAAGEPFEAEACDQLYQRYVAGLDLAQLEKVRSEMAGILREVGESVADAGRNVSQYNGRLQSITEDVERQQDIKDVKALLQTLVAETRSMQEATRELKTHFDAKSAEIASLREELERERQRALTDPLTGLPNRQALFDAIDGALNDPESKRPPCIMMVDIDSFKRINDQYGHLIGDRVIRFVAKVLTQHTKGADTAARYGGEEFAVLLPQTPMQGAIAVGETLRQAVADAKLVRSDTKEPLGRVTISVGIAAYRQGEDVMAFVNRADRALYLSKERGRNRVTTETELTATAAS